MSSLLDDPPRTPPRRLPKPVGLLIVLAVVIALVGGVAIGGQKLLDSFGGVDDYSGTGGPAVVVQVQSGDSLSDIADTLVAKGVVKSTEAFVEAAKDDARATRVQPGFYSLKTMLPGQSALSALLDPKSRLRGRVTLPEGIPLATVVDRLTKFTDLKRPDVIAALDNPSVLGLPSYAKGKVEGFLFPATYDVEPGSAAVDALTQMTDKFAEVAAELDLEGRAQALDLTPYEVVTIASLVEAETPLDADRPKVARVVLNRLMRGMPLQFDSTVNYARTEKRARLSLQDIKVESPYNTYLNKGLPPTPINSPGAKALEAALAPATGDYVYFITIDKAGNSLFTNDYQEFLRAKAKAQRDGVY